MKNGNPNIRPYKSNDRDTLLNLLRLNTPEYFAPEEELDFQEYLENQIELYFVIEWAEQVVGCGGINFADQKTTGRISWDIIHPDFQRKSLGKILLDYRLSLLQSIPTIEKITVRTSQLAWQFYEKNGFRLVEIKKDFWAAGLDMYFMEFLS